MQKDLHSWNWEKSSRPFPQTGTNCTPFQSLPNQPTNDSDDNEDEEDEDRVRKDDIFDALEVMGHILYLIQEHYRQMRVLVQNPKEESSKSDLKPRARRNPIRHSTPRLLFCCCWKLQFRNRGRWNVLIQGIKWIAFNQWKHRLVTLLSILLHRTPVTQFILTRLATIPINKDTEVDFATIPISPRCKNFLFRILSFAFVFVMLTLSEILGSCVHKFVLHLEDVFFQLLPLPRGYRA